MTKYIKVSHWVLCSPTSIFWSCAKASLCQWKITHTQQLSKATARDWHIQKNYYPPAFSSIWVLQKKKKEKKPMANNILRYLIALNSSLREKEEFCLYREKFTKGQSLQKPHFKIVIKETVKFPFTIHLYGIWRNRIWEMQGIVIVSKAKEIWNILLKILI